MAWGSCYTPDFRAASLLGAAAGTTALNDRRLVENIVDSASGQSFVADAIDTGRYAMRIDSNTALSNVSLSLLAASSRYAGLMFRFRVNALAANLVIARITASTVGDSYHVRVSSAGVLQYSVANQTAWTDVPDAPTINVGDVHRFEMFVDWDVSTTHTFKIRLDGVELLNTTGGTTAVTSVDPAFGSTAIAATSSCDYADMAVYNDPAQYGTMDDWRVFGVEPVSDGTHNTSADFQDQTSTSLSGTTTSWQLVDDAPAAAPSTTNFVKQTTSATGAFLEWVLDVIPSGYGDPAMVCLAAALHPVASATSTNLSQFRLNAGGNVSTEATRDQSITADTLEYRKHHYQTRPDGATWLNSDVTTTPLRVRYGFSTDIVPVPACDAVMAFVLVPALEIPEVNMARTRS